MPAAKNTRKSIRTPLQERARGTVDAILTAATRILGQEGIEGASTNKIAEKAGVGIASLYQYFKNKDQIIHALIQKLFDRKMKVIFDSLEGMKSATLEEAVQSLVHALIESKRANIKLEQVLEAQVPPSEAMKILAKADADLMKLLKEFLAPFIKELGTKDLDLKLYAVIYSVRSILVMSNQAHPEYLFTETLEDVMVKMTLAGLKA